MNPTDFLNDAIAERDAAIERRVREEVAAELETFALCADNFLATRSAYSNAARIARGGAA